MNGVSHAATALLIRRRWPSVPLALALVCVQASDVLWFALTSVGLERVTYSDQVRSLADIHFVHMPFSHALVSAALLAVAAAAVSYGVRGSSALAWAVAAAVLSHVVLDVAVHAPDIALSYWSESVKLGSGLYGVPTVALAVELLYAVFCWRVARGSRKLLLWLLALNLAGISLYVAAVPGPERWFDSRRQLFPVLVLAQAVAGSAAVYVLHRDGALRRS